MKKLGPYLFLTALLAPPALAQKVFVDFDDTVDFSQYETFAFKESPEDLRNTNELGHRRILEAIGRQLTETGFIESESDPDMWVTYHAAEEDQIRIDSANLGYGYGSGWYGRGWHYGGYWGLKGGGYSTTVSKYSEGTLAIDIWDAEKNQMMWRGIATAVVPSSSAKREKKLDKALDKMSEEYQKRLRNNAKKLGKS
jgi:hypothetical protein